MNNLDATWTTIHQLYDWTKFFKAVVAALVEIGSRPDRGSALRDAAIEAFGVDAAISRYDEVDPLSFVYFLAQRNTAKQRITVYSSVQTALSISESIPTDWIFPTPQPNAPALYHDGVSFETDILWDFFLQCAGNTDPDQESFRHTLTVKNVGIVKLTQTMFLVNPDKFLPWDDRVSFMPGHSARLRPAGKNTSYPMYREWLSAIRETFPGCAPYEINIFAFAVQSRTVVLTNNYYQVGSNVFGETDKDTGDWIGEFFEKSAVWVGGPTSGGSGTKVYPIQEVNPGDIILSHFNHFGNGIGVVVDNQYARRDQFSSDDVIRVVWINKEEQPHSLNSTQSAGFSRAHSIKDSFRENYPVTFDLLDDLRRSTGNAERLRRDYRKNLVLQGPPGSGKTRLALQLAVYLQNKDASLTNFLIDKRVFDEHPIFQNDPPDISDNENITLIQFHPNYTYEDFVRGITSQIDEAGKAVYRIVDRTLMKVVKRAAQFPHDPYILIIDEMNRANLPAVLGELVYALEYRGKAIEGLYEDPDTNSNQITIPENLYIIGTMNTADRSVGHIDYAIRRRFVFMDVMSEAKWIQDPTARIIYEKTREIFTKPENLSPDFHAEDVIPGHSYFLLEPTTTIQERLELEIKPLLREYVRDGILVGESVANDIQELGT